MTGNRIQLDALREHFRLHFGHSNAQDERIFYAPGRVNLIGDHTDYTGGLVFPCGIDRGSHLVIRRNNSRQYRFASRNFEVTTELGADEITSPKKDAWINYPLGVINQFLQRGLDIDGVDCLFSGDIPNGAGLSSSASIEVVTAVALNTLFDAGLDRIELVKLAQKAENEFVGMQCGIMDQFAVTMAKQEHAMLLDCHSIEHRQVPLDLDEYALVVINTNHRRELNDSAYNQRVKECARALELLEPSLGINRLGELNPDALDRHVELFSEDPIALARARHVANENARVRQAVHALESGDITGFGQLMNESHDSLATDYEVSSAPLDTLVSLARNTGSVLGSRLTGAGFGGCTVNLVRRQELDLFEANVGQGYLETTGLEADFYRFHAGNGAGAADLDSL